MDITLNPSANKYCSTAEVWSGDLWPHLHLLDDGHTVHDPHLLVRGGRQPASLQQPPRPLPHPHHAVPRHCCHFLPQLLQ